jgi:hypothetical protein
MTNQHTTATVFTYTITFSIPATIVPPPVEEELLEEEAEEVWTLDDYVYTAGTILEYLAAVNTADNPEIKKPTDKAMLRCLDVMSCVAALVFKKSAGDLKK